MYLKEFERSPEIGTKTGSLLPFTSSNLVKPSPPLFPLLCHQESPHRRFTNSDPNSNRNINFGHSNHLHHAISTPHKRPVVTPAPIPTSTPAAAPPASRRSSSRRRRLSFYAATTRTALRYFLRRLHLRLRLLLLLLFPFLYILLSSSPPSGRSFLLHFVSTITFLSAILLLIFLFFLNSFPVPPSLRLLISRSSAFLRPRYHLPHHRPAAARVLWSIGSDDKPKAYAGHLASGLGGQVYSNGDVYEGEFYQGKYSGSGVYSYYMSGRYEGNWVDEKYEGYGVETWARGSRYRGQYKKGLRHGYGVYHFYTGDVYAGEWFNGHTHGTGVHTCENGSRYVGQFMRGVKHGLGYYHFRNGDAYTGEYFADKMQGFGVYCFANGHQYEGAWHEGKRQGLGMYTFHNGETQSGHWHNSTLDTLNTQSTTPWSPIAVNHSKVLNAVQEARKAAEKAYNVARVDDRVNKAVAAANKAANAARVLAVKAVQKRIVNNGHDIPLQLVLGTSNMCLPDHSCVGLASVVEDD